MKVDKSVKLQDKVSKLLHDADGAPYKIVYKTKRRYTPGSRKANSYINFCKEFSKKLRTETPGIKFKEVGVLAGEKWRSLTHEEKSVYVHQSAPVVLESVVAVDAVDHVVVKEESK